MQRLWRHKALLSLGSICLLIVAGWTTAQGWMQEKTDPLAIFPASTFFIAHMDGMQNHAEAYAQTAEYDAFYQSGLAELFDNTLTFLIDRDTSGSAARAREAIDHLIQQGFVVGSYLPETEGPPIPTVALVLPQAAEWHDEALALIQDGTKNSPAELMIETIEERSVAHLMIPNSPGLQFGFWAEGEHLVFVVGPEAVQSAISCASGKTPNLLTNTKWMEVATTELDFDQNSLIWLDWQALQKTYGGIPLPLPTGSSLTVQQVLEMAGLDKIDHFLSRSGFKGSALWGEALISKDGSEKPSSLTLADLPPLPVKFTSFSAMEIDVAGLYQQGIALARQVAALAGERESAQLEELLENRNEILGFDPEADLIEHLGNVACLYDDANGGVFGMGLSLCIKLKNPEKVAEFISQQMDRLEAAEENGNSPDLMVYPIRIEKNDQEMIVFDVYDNNYSATQLGAMQVVEDWLVISLMPQSVEAFRMRLTEELPRWTPTAEYTESFGLLPEKFSTVTVVNTRDSYQLVLNWFTSFLPMIQKFALEGEFLQEDEMLPFYVEDFPPAERITSPLYPNVSMTVCNEQGTRMFSRASTYGIPLPGGNGGVGTVAIGGTMMALLLPAVQQAREAARRTQSKNNLKQMGLAMHNYHDTFNGFPQGTVPNEDLKPEQRLSWTYSILPFMEQAALYEQMDREEKWDSENNVLMAETLIPQYQNPAEPTTFVEEFATIHYAGMAGVGKDAPELPLRHKRAGIFGYDRQTRMRDITDGTSNTIMITEINKDLGPWSQGGSSTIRSLTQKPYVNGPDGIGNPNGQYVQVLMADGSVRVVSKDIDPKTFERLAQMADGEPIGEF